MLQVVARNSLDILVGGSGSVAKVKAAFFRAFTDLAEERRVSIALGRFCAFRFSRGAGV